MLAATMGEGARPEGADRDPEEERREEDQGRLGVDRHGRASPDSASWFVPVRLEIDAQTVGQAVDECEVGGDRRGVVDHTVVEAVGSELIDIRRCHAGRLSCELLGIVEKGSIGRVEIGEDGTEIALEGAGPFGVGGQLTERRPVMPHSIVAIVDLADGDGDHLAPDP